MAYVDPAVLSQKPDAIGRAIPGGTLSLIDEAGEPVTAAGAEGELIYSGPNVMLGYAEQTGDLARGRDIAVLHTGDLAVRDADGDFRLVGRKQRFVKPYGLRVSLDAIEAKLAADGIRAMAAGDDGLIAIAATGHVGPASLRADLARWLSLPENLFDVLVLPEFPMLASGKRDYKSILGAAQLRRMSAKGLDTRGKGFAAQFSAILGREVQQSDSFISLHGDSLSYVNVLIAIDEYLGKVPDNWESLTVAELDALSLAAPVATPRWIKPFDTEVVLRALAIMAVVLVHAKFLIVSGGADALIILAGYNLARFNKGRLIAGLGWEIFENFVKRIILPFYFILLLYTIFRENPGITAFLLVDNFSSDPERLRTIIAPFWFIQALLHCMLAIVVLFSFKPIRQLASTMPLAFAVILLMLATVIRVTAFSLYDHSYPRNFYTTDSIVIHFALGWLVFAAQSLRARLACVAAAALLGAANGGMLGLQDWIGGWPVDVGVRRMIWIVLVPALLLFIPRILLPVWIGRALTSVAAISFTIYLVHMLPIHLLRPFDAVSPFVKLAIALIVSFGVHALVTWLWRVKQAAWLSSRWRTKHS